jgi:hypothetical protein
MKYICLGYIKPGTFEDMTEDERNSVFDECFQHNDHLRARRIEQKAAKVSKRIVLRRS